MTTSLPHTHIRLRDLSELVAGIPYVLGFPPTNSLVLFTFRRRPDLVLSTTIRVDLPKPEHFSLVAAELANAVAINEAVAVIAVAVGEEAEGHGQLIDSVREALAERGILLSHASWVDRVVHGEQWQCYDDPLCTGIVPDPQSSALAAACAVAGDTTYPTREAIAAHLASEPAEALAVRRKLLDAYRMPPFHPYTNADRGADMELLGMALDMATTSYAPPALTDDQLARLGIALSQTPIKDECLAIALSDEREPAERLWTVLVRALPAPERAEPAFLLAMSAYLRGAGVMAALALGIVMEADPLHNTAVLLDFSLRMGIPPDQLKSLLMTSILKNDEDNADSAAVDDDPPWDTSPEQQWRMSMPEPIASDAPDSEETVTASPAQPVHTVWPTHRRVDTEPANDSSSSPSCPPEAAPTLASSRTCPADDLDPREVHAVPSSADSVTDAAKHAVETSWLRTAAGRDESAEADHQHVLEPDGASPGRSAYIDGVPDPPPGATSSTTGDPRNAVESLSGIWGSLPPIVRPEAPKIPPGPLSQQAAVALGIHVEEPVTQTVTMDALTAFLPPPTDRSGPG